MVDFIQCDRCGVLFRQTRDPKDGLRVEMHFFYSSTAGVPFASKDLCKGCIERLKEWLQPTTEYYSREQEGSG